MTFNPVTLAHLEEELELKQNGTNGNGHHPIDVDPNKTAIEEAVKTTLKAIGEDPVRDGLRRTPERVARKGRLQPGRMFLVDMQQGRIVA